MELTSEKKLGLLSIPVLVAALGYFVDIYDLLLFSIVRKSSLRSIGLSEELINTQGMDIIGHQMYGLLIGGIIWGVLGDKKGRLSVLFGSILLYSTANIFNGFVQTAEQYSWCRFIAGIGLAGELGAGITLVSELIDKQKRGVATSLVAGIGLTGAVFAYFIHSYFDWRTCYFIGGGLGFSLLALRVTVFESGMFKNMQHENVSKGNFFMLFTKWSRFKKYFLAILIGLPTWYVIGILVSFSDKFAKEFHVKGEIDPGKAVMFAYVAISIGDVLIGLVSQWLKSRKKAMLIFYGITIVAIALFFSQEGASTSQVYFYCALMGFGTGFWAIFVTMAAEHFGTNLRATVATTVPNMVRGALPLLIWMFNSLRGSQTYINAGITTGIIAMSIAIIAVLLTEETFGKDLNFMELDEDPADKQGLEKSYAVKK